MAVILIIDDSPTELHLFQGMLEKNGFNTLVADSGEEGLRQAKTSRHSSCWRRRRIGGRVVEEQFRRV